MYDIYCSIIYNLIMRYDVNIYIFIKLQIYYTYKIVVLVSTIPSYNMIIFIVAFLIDMLD